MVYLSHEYIVTEFIAMETIPETKPTLTQEHSLPVPRWLTAQGFVALLGISLSLPSSHPLSLGCTDFFLPNQVRFSSKPFLTVMFPSAF